MNFLTLRSSALLKLWTELHQYAFSQNENPTNLFPELHQYAFSQNESPLLISLMNRYMNCK